MKKQIIIGGLSLLFMSSVENFLYETNIHNITKDSRLELIIKKEHELRKEEISTEKKVNIFLEEAALIKEDKIYRTIYSFHKNEKFLIPKYITPKFIRALINHESEDNPKAISKVGARGLGQFMELTWYEVGERNYSRNSFIPEINIRATIKYLCLLDRRISIGHPHWKELGYEERLKLISAAYNGGTKRLENSNWDVSKMKLETRKYYPYIEKASKKFIPSAEIYQSVL